MSFSINFHPDGKWELIKCEHYGPNSGSCINFWFDDNTVSIHYGGQENRFDFITQFKKVVAALPNECPTCGKE